MARSEAGGAHRRIPLTVVGQGASLIPSDFSESHTLLVTFGFRCNLACVFCMVEDVLGVYAGADLATFRAFLADRDAMKDIRRITFSGGEATLERELFEYVRLARRAPGVEHVRLQTNATRLANRAYLSALVDAGVDEFFVSIHGPDAAICDALTAKRGSFRAIMAGVEAVASSPASLMTNTAIVAPNHDRLRDIVTLLAPYGPRSMDFWSIWPRIDKDDARGMFVRVTDVQPHLFSALEACEDGGIVPIVKWFPHCLLGRFARYHDDSQPTVLVEQSYWDEAPTFACLYEGICAHAPQPCTGLSVPYVRKFGWEEDVLVPARTALAGLGRETAATAHPGNALGAAAPETAKGPALERLRLTPGQTLGGFRFASVRPHQRALVVTLRASDGAELRVRLYEPDPTRPCYARTARFDLVYENVPQSLAPRIEAPLQALLAHLRALETR